MADQSTTEPGEDLANPFEAPTAAAGEPWGTGDPALEAIRRANLTDEAYLKTLVQINLLTAATTALAAAYHLSSSIWQDIGQFNVPWVSKPNWVAFDALLGVMPILGSLGAFGLHRRRPWAILVEALLVVDILIFWVFPLINRETPTPILYFVAGAVFALCVVTPFLNVLDLREAVVFGSDYLRVIDATSYIRVKPKLPLSLRLTMAVFALIFLGLAVYLTSA